MSLYRPESPNIANQSPPAVRFTEAILATSRLVKTLWLVFTALLCHTATDLFVALVTKTLQACVALAALAARLAHHAAHLILNTRAILAVELLLAVRLLLAAILRKRAAGFGFVTVGVLCAL